MLHHRTCSVQVCRVFTVLNKGTHAEESKLIGQDTYRSYENLEWIMHVKNIQASGELNVFQEHTQYTTFWTSEGTQTHDL